MSSRANSSARSRRAGPGPNIQDTLTPNPQPSSQSQQHSSSNPYNPNTFSEKQEPKLLSITQAFMLINGKIRSLESQVESMNKIIDTSSQIPAIQNNYEEMSDVSEFRQSAIDEDFFDINLKPSATKTNANTSHKSVPDEPSVVFDEGKAIEIVTGVTKDTFKQYDSRINALVTENTNINNQYSQLNERTDNINIQLLTIEDLVKNIQELNAKLPDFMTSVNNRFETLHNGHGTNAELVRITMSKVDKMLTTNNEKIEGVQKSMANMQKHSVSLHNLFTKRFDLFEKQNDEKNVGTAHSELEESVKKVIFDMKQNNVATIENCLNDDEEEELEEEEVEEEEVEEEEVEEEEVEEEEVEEEEA